MTLRYIIHSKQLSKTNRFFNVNQVLLLVAHYGLEPVIATLKKYGIKVAELQHGVLYPDHFGYNLHTADNPAYLPIPDRFIFHDAQVMQNLKEVGKFRSMDLCTYKNIPLHFQRNPHDDQKRFCVVLFSQPGLIKSGDQILEFVNDVLSRCGIKSTNSIYVFSHPRESYTVDGLNYINSLVSYKDALQSCDYAITTSMSVVCDAMSVGRSIYYTDYRSNIQESNLLSTLGVKYDKY